MSKSLKERLREMLRLQILTVLTRVEARRVTAAILQLALRDLGMEQARDVLEGELRWLDRQGLVKLDEIEGGGLKIALTERGDLAARGVTEEPGVARPALD